MDGAGYIGSQVVKQFSEDKNNYVTIVDNLCRGEFDAHLQHR